MIKLVKATAVDIILATISLFPLWFSPYISSHFLSFFFDVFFFSSISLLLANIYTQLRPKRNEKTFAEIENRISLSIPNKRNHILLDYIKLFKAPIQRGKATHSLVSKGKKKKGVTGYSNTFLQIINAHKTKNKQRKINSRYVYKIIYSIYTTLNPTKWL